MKDGTTTVWEGILGRDGVLYSASMPENISSGRIDT